MLHFRILSITRFYTGSTARYEAVLAVDEEAPPIFDVVVHLRTLALIEVPACVLLLSVPSSSGPCQGSNGARGPSSLPKGSPHLS